MFGNFTIVRITMLTTAVRGLTARLQVFTKGQIWVITTAMLFLAVLSYWGLVSWEANHEAEIAALTQRQKSFGAEMIELCPRLPTCNPAELLRDLDHTRGIVREASNAYYAKRSWLRPLTLLFALGISPGAVLAMQWLWHSRPPTRA